MPVSIGGNGPITGVTSINTTVTDTELGYLDGVTSALQTQINAKANTSTQGMLYLGQFSATAASRIDMTNMFYSYGNLRLVIYANTSPGGQWVSLRWLSGSSPSTAAGYRYAQARMGFSGSPSVSPSGGFGATSIANFMYVSNEARAWVDLSPTYATWMAVDNGGGVSWGGQYSELGVPIDGLCLFPASSGTISGNIRVYSYKEP